MCCPVTKYVQHEEIASRTGRRSGVGRDASRPKVQQRLVVLRHLCGSLLPIFLDLDADSFYGLVDPSCEAISVRTSTRGVLWALS